MGHAYLELKLSWELFNRPPDSLSEPERHRLSKVADRQQGIETRILSSPLAASVVVPPDTLKSRLAEIRGRYASDDEMTRDLDSLGLDRQSLSDGLERELKVESVLEKVASAMPPVSAVDAEIFYRVHPEAFDRPEARKLRHILITFDGPSEKAKARTTLEKLRTRIISSVDFGNAALRHSQCPTAMEGGQLGTIRRNQLYAELEGAAFSLPAGRCSPVIESPIGLHIIFCDEILPCGMLPFDAVRDRILERLTDKRRHETQRDWIKALRIST